MSLPPICLFCKIIFIYILLRLTLLILMHLILPRLLRLLGVILSHVLPSLRAVFTLVTVLIFPVLLIVLALSIRRRIRSIRRSSCHFRDSNLVVVSFLFFESLLFLSEYVSS